MSQKNIYLPWILWHPHQGLWNWSLIAIIKKIIPIPLLSNVIRILIIQADTLILFILAVIRRASLVGCSRIFDKAKIPKEISILYFDLGTHKEGEELSLMVDHILPRICDNFEAYGFEASQQSFEQAEEKFSGRKNVKIIHAALCHNLPDDGKIKLYKDMKEGIGNSLYRKTTSYEEVDAMRLSDFFRMNNMDFENKISLVRMNIEGAEYDVLIDLIANGFAKHISGYFGMWDDLSKIDIERDNEFRAFLSKNKIQTFPFNGRDLRWPLRIKCIEYHIQTLTLWKALELQKNN